MVRAAAGSAAGAIVGTIVWAIVMYFTSYELGIIAWVIGVLAGGGAFVLAREDLDATTGLAAAAIAVGGIGMGKYASVQIQMHEARSSIVARLAPTEAECVAAVAETTARRLDSDGKKVAWPAGMSAELAKREEDFPKEIWSRARAEWEAMSPRDRAGVTEGLIAKRSKDLEIALSEARQDAFRASLTPLDFLWFGLAVASAFKLGSVTPEG